MIPKFNSFLFDNRKAWESVLQDPRYYYDMPFDEFMALYTSYRRGNNYHRSSIPIIKTYEQIADEKKENTSQLLNQLEIDNIVNRMLGDIETQTVKTPQNDEMSGLLSQSDIDNLFATMK